MQYEKLSGSRTFLALILGLFLGMGLDRIPIARDNQPNFRLVAQASDLIQRYYVDRKAEQAPALTYGAISGMVNALGDTGHSTFLSPTLVKEMAEIEKNRYQGIGAEVQSKNGHIVIVAPLDGSPAQHAGIKPGDIILQVDDQNVSGDSVDQVVKKVSGPAGTSVRLTILTPASGITRQITLTRATLRIQSVTWDILPGTKIVQLRIAAFDKGMADDLRSALSEIKKQPVAGLILDLRNNPGGILDEAVDCASQFLKGGNVLLVKNARGQEKPIPAKAGGEAAEIPLVVLINRGTASGAEIMAGALRDAHRGPLVGETTFGTGTVLTEFKLADGSALLLAIEEWLTPAGDVIWHKGINPNFVVPLSANVLPVTPETARSMTAEELQHSSDAQLLKAMELLHS